MNQNNQLNNVWLKAAVLGCLWASSEIVLGSFLHNLRIPFRGDFLTAIGIILMVSASYLWNEKGLIWRAGLICALMKSISPSAVIFGPMLAIMSEALMMEFAIRVFRRNILAYLIGGILAMSWTFIQKLFGFVILYGFHAVTLYENLTKFAQKQLNIHFENIWFPIIALWGIYFVVGILAASFGIYIGKKTINNPVTVKGISKSKIIGMQTKNNVLTFRYSLLWFWASLVAMIAILCLINFTSWYFWVSGGLIAVISWSIRYQRALKPLKKPKFWISFILITMLASFLFSKLQNGQSSIYDGLMIGLQMNFQAIVMIIGFSVLGTELCNPKIRAFFVKTAFRQLPLALEVAFDTLPFVIANMPTVKDIFKSPLSIIQQLVSQADFWLEKMTLKLKKKGNIMIITGNKGQGKTSFLNEILISLEKSNVKTSGILSRAIIENNVRVGYDILNLSTNEKAILSRTFGKPEMIRVSDFYFYPEGFEIGKKALSIEQNKDSQIIFIDEIGPWELDNQGWAPQINNLLKNSDTPMIWTVRESLVEQVIDNWSLDNPLIINVSEYHKENYFNQILDYIKPHNN